MTAPVSAHLEAELRDYTRQNGLVAWLDKEGLYLGLTDHLARRHPRRGPRLLLEVPPRARLRVGAASPGRDRPQFTLDEDGSDAARAAFEAAHPKKVAEMVEAERKRRAKKQKKADEQGDLFGGKRP